MDARTLEALQASIAKWERNAVAKTADDYSTSAGSCPLCNLFLDDRCVGCPVFGKTDSRFCYGTPYSIAMEARWDWTLSRASAEPAHAAAREEVAFLQSLLPAALKATGG